MELDLALPVAPGEVLYAEVGAPGSSGFGGGGAGGTGAGGGAGGGASDVRTCSLLAASCAGGGSSAASRLVVASGGGGLGGSPPSSEVDVGSTCGANNGGGAAWDGLAPVSVAGGTVLDGENDLIGNTGVNRAAEGGMSAGPGLGGMVLDCMGGGRTYFGSVSGSTGSGASGGAGGNGSTGAGGGGGGGGGYFGGGGGPSGQLREGTPCGSGGGTCVSTGSGGAGGSSFYTSQATGRIFYTDNYLTGESPVVAVTPLIEIDSPSAGARYTQGEVVDASYSCAECSGGPGRGGTVPSGSPIDTATVGPHTFTASDISHSGASPAISTVQYSVIAPQATCSTNTGTVTLSPGLTSAPAVQTMKIKGTLTGCTGRQFTETKYTATLKTGSPVSCSVLKSAGEAATGASKYAWAPKVKTSKGTLNMLLTETPAVAFSGELASGSYSPLMLSGAVTEGYTGTATCGAKRVKKGTFTGSAVTFE
jgi:hypothetical protein